MIGDPNTGLSPAALTRSFDTTGKPPGTYTIRARVTDNGAVNGSDPARASKIVTSTFTINSPPAPDDQTVDLEADATQPKAITLTASDADGDPFTFDVPAAATTGTLTGTNASRSYTWPSTFTGNDVFPFTATDDKNGTGLGTLTVRVRPNTTIDTAAPTGATQVQAAHFAFSSPQAPIARYECRLLRNTVVVPGEDWATCAIGSTGTKDYADLADGSYRFEVRAVNAVGQADGTPAAHTWRVDTTPPGTVFASGPNGPTNDPTPTWTLQVDDASPQESVTYECRTLFGPMSGTWVPCGAPASPIGSAPIDLVDAGGGLFGITDPLTEGTYSIEARATDEVGLLGPATTRTITVDLTPPGTNIASGPEGLINTRNVVFGATATEAGSTFRCELVGETQGTVFADGPCPGGAAPAFSGLADDVYHLTITAVDPAGNLDPTPPVADFEVDATNPDTSLVSGPPATTQSRKATIVFSGTDNRALAGYECRFDSSADEDWTPCESPETYAGLADGPHTAEIRAVDEATNRDPSPVVVDWTIDRTPPTTTIDVRPPARSNDDSPLVEFSANEPSTFECSLDAPSAWQACTSSLDVSTIGGPLSDGPHALRIRATDTAGNLEATPALLSWSVDTVDPEVTLDSVPLDPSPAGDAEVGFSVKDGSPLAPAPEVATECAIDEDLSASPSTYDWQPCTDPLVIPSPGDGDHTVAVRARDGAGNVSAVKTHAWTVLATAPSAPTIDNAAPAAGSRTRLSNATIAFSHPNEDVLTLECRLDGSAWQACESPYTVTSLPDGDHQLDVRARDAVGNTSPAVSHAWTVDSDAPATTIDGGPTGLTRSKTAVFRFSSNKSPVTFECRLDDADWAACETNMEVNDLPDGRHTMRVRAVEDSDPAALKDPTPPARTWTVDATAPDTTITAGPSGKVAVQTAQFSFASDDPAAHFQCKLDSEEYDACTSPINLAGLTEGEHTLFVRAVDAAGNRDETPAEGAWVVSVPAPEPPATDSGPAGNFQATLASGSIRLGSIAPVDLAAGQATLDGSLAGDGTLTVPASGVQFKPLTLPVEVGTLKLNARIILSATGPATGKVPLAGGPAALSVPIQVKVEAELDNGTPLLGSTSQCFIAPLTFDLGGSYDAATQKLTLSAPAVTVPQAGDGCGALGAQVNALLGLPSDNNAVSLVFSLGGAAPTTPTNNGGGPTTTPTAKAALGTVKATLSKNTLSVPVKCTGAAAAKCRGVVSLVTTVKSGKKTKTVVLGKVSYSTTGGKTVTTKLKLTSSGLKLLTAAGKKGLRTKLQLVPSGQTKTSSTKTFTLKSPVPAKKKKGAKR